MRGAAVFLGVLTVSAGVIWLVHTNEEETRQVIVKLGPLPAMRVLRRTLCTVLGTAARRLINHADAHTARPV